MLWVDFNRLFGWFLFCVLHFWQIKFRLNLVPSQLFTYFVQQVSFHFCCSGFQSIFLKKKFPKRLPPHYCWILLQSSATGDDWPTSTVFYRISQPAPCIMLLHCVGLCKLPLLVRAFLHTKNKAEETVLLLLLLLRMVSVVMSSLHKFLRYPAKPSAVLLLAM